MKTIILTLFAVMFISLTSCEKETIEPSKPGSKDQLKDCKDCGGSWDITDPKGP